MATKIPSALKTTSVIAIVLGALFGCCAIHSGASVVIQQVMVQQLDSGALDATDPSMASMLAFQREAAIVNAISTVTGFCASLLLLFAGAWGLSGRKSGRTILITAYSIGLAALLAEVVVTLWGFFASQRLMGSMTSGLPMGADERNFANMSLGIALIVPAIWIFVRLGALIAGLAFTLHRDVAEWYTRGGVRSSPREP